MSFGKIFVSLYSGSMFGKPAIVFAVWGYVIANMRPSRQDGQCYVELNPSLLAATFATTPDEILDALAVLEAPDEASRTKTDDGRRLVLLEDRRHTGPMQYRVVNGAHYRAVRDEDERREQNRAAKQRERGRQPMSAAVSHVSADVSNVSHGQPMSAQAEAEAEAEAFSSGSRPKAAVFGDDSEPMLLARHLFGAIRSNDPKAKEPRWQTWAAEIERLNRIDGRDFAEIRSVIDWCQRDQFWRSNILSAGALRKSYQKLLLKMRGDESESQPRSAAVRPRFVPIAQVDA